MHLLEQATQTDLPMEGCQLTRVNACECQSVGSAVLPSGSLQNFLQFRGFFFL